MTYSLPIRDAVYNVDPELGSGPRKSWWANFTTTIRQEHLGLDLKFKQEEWLEYRTEMLAKYNAWYDGTRVHFATKQDATLFLLKWS